MKYAVPTVPADDESFDRWRYWRGPVWPIVNFLIADGLVRYGEGDRATRLATDLASMVSESGFFEYFDSMSGDGLGGENFSWTAAIWLGWWSTFRA